MGAPHNFVDEKLIRELNYAIDEANTMKVRVDNGDKLESKVVCQPLVWRVHGWEFQFNLRTLKLGGTDMVLGLNWMSQFGPIIFDFVRGFVRFKYKQEEITLQNGDPASQVMLIEMKEVDDLLTKHSYGVAGQLYTITEGKEEEIPKQIMEVIGQFLGVSKEPKGLPPHRSHDHQIPLKEGAQPFKKWKSKFEKLVKEMLVGGGADNINPAYATLHYLLNPRVVKRTRQLLTTQMTS